MAKYRTVFDIIGPVMVGPSSSHTAGAARIGGVARSLLGCTPKKVHLCLFGSFAETYQGHGTDVALLAGLLGLAPCDARLRDAWELARAAGMEVEIALSTEVADHPNTVRLILTAAEHQIEVVGISIGGGKIELVEVNGFSLRNLSGCAPIVLIFHQDRHGVVAQAAAVLAKHEINISFMQVSRQAKGEQALMAIETDQPLDEALREELSMITAITRVMLL